MEQSKALAVLISALLGFSCLLSVLAADPKCPDSCLTESNIRTLQQPWGQGQALRIYCRCPDENGKGSPCSWVGHGGTYNFPVCLDAMPTDFHKATKSIFIKHLRSPMITEHSFPNVSALEVLHIRTSNVSTIQPGAFQGLPLVDALYLDDNLISLLEPDTFLGLKNLRDLAINKNEISLISHHAFRGLPLLAYLSLAQNNLRSVPVDTLLQPKALGFTNLNTNQITSINSDIMRLKQNQRLHLMVEGNRLDCDRNLTWFVCNLPDLDHLSFSNLKCASPPELCGTLLTTMRKDFIEFGRCDDTSTTTAASTAGTTVGTRTTKLNMNVSVILEGDPAIGKDDKSYLFAMIAAVAVPLLVVSTLTVFFVINNHCRGTAALACPNVASGPDQGEPSGSTDVQVSTTSSAASRQPNPANVQTSGDDDTIQPYAVSYMDVSGKGKNGKLAPYATTTIAHHQMSGDDDTIQPYAVTYMDVSGKGKNGKLAPYATTTIAHDQTPEDNDDIQPYAVTYMDVSGKGKNGKLAPYATTTIAHDQTPEDNDDIQPYPVTYMDVSGKGKNGKLAPYAKTSFENTWQFHSTPVPKCTANLTYCTTQITDSLSAGQGNLQCCMKNSQWTLDLPTHS
ncbi:SLITRK5 [Branchiostoma lanceolatum]|uniref:SLITRK5 protein n=1 Tax=Branchiostoma lanceolatum TaxID=7740 RepID=A0A8J9ZE67_BRALA|nr:SLITRK5 [Branchiostoma lanceolatum]